MNVNRRTAAKLLSVVKGLTAKQAYEATKGIIGKRKPPKVS